MILICYLSGIVKASDIPHAITIGKMRAQAVKRSLEIELKALSARVGYTIYTLYTLVNIVTYAKA